jgi:guanylate kinase
VTADDGGGLVVVISGPSGVGKGTVLRRVLAQIDEATFSVSVTTRPPRTGERDGVDYHFVDDAEFDRIVVEGGFLEWAEYAGRRYGTLRDTVDAGLAEGRVVLLDIEVETWEVADGLSGPYSVFGPNGRLIGVYEDEGPRALPQVILAG